MVRNHQHVAKSRRSTKFKIHFKRLVLLTNSVFVGEGMERIVLVWTHVKGGWWDRTNLWQEELDLDSKTANTYGHQVQLNDFVWLIFLKKHSYPVWKICMAGFLKLCRSFATYLFLFVNTESFTLKNVDERDG